MMPGNRRSPAARQHRESDVSEVPDGSISLPARVIPLPQTISAEARAFLANPMFKAEPDTPALDDIQGWRDHVARGNAMLSASMAGRVATFAVKHSVFRLEHCDVYEIVPNELASDSKALLFIHGGAFIMGGGEGALYQAVQIAALTGLTTWSVDYRMPPDHPFPAGLDDCVEAWRRITERFAPENVAVHGGSAGANIAAAMVLKARDAGLPLPAACVLHSPVADLRQVGDTMTTNVELDVVLKRPSDWIAPLYSGGHDLTDPYVSPLFGDFTKGFPPTLLTSGTRDLLLSDTVRLHRALRNAGVRAELHVWEAMCHGMAPGAPEARELVGEQVRFTREVLGIA